MDKKWWFINNKKGSHVGMIISFVVFITFVTFVFVVLKPAINLGEGKQVSLDDTELKITQNVSANFTIASVSFADIVNPNRDCVTIQKIITVLEFLPPYRLIIKNENSITQESYLFAETIPDIRINRGDQSNVFFKIYESPKFEPLGTNTGLICDTVRYIEGGTSQYKIGTVYAGQYAFESEVRKLIELYNANYSSVKQSLKISPANEFSFSLILSNGTRLEATQSINAKNIYAQETPIQYVDADANIQAGYIVTKIW
jgi:hypothetical protein